MSTEKDKVNTGLLGAIAAILTLSVIGVAFAVTALVRNSEDEQLAEKSAGAAQPAIDLKTQQETELTAATAWADKDKGTASVPIDRAMALVVDKIKANPEWATPAPPPPPEDAGTDGEADASDAGAEGDAETTGADTDAGAETTADAGAQPAAPETPEPKKPPTTPAPKAPAPPTTPAPAPPAPEEPTAP
jgi:hypothetical protein